MCQKTKNHPELKMNYFVPRYSWLYLYPRYKTKEKEIIYKHTFPKMFILTQGDLQRGHMSKYPSHCFFFAIAVLSLYKKLKKIIIFGTPWQKISII